MGPSTHYTDLRRFLFPRERSHAVLDSDLRVGRKDTLAHHFLWAAPLIQYLEGMLFFQASAALVSFKNATLSCNLLPNTKY